MEIHGEINGEKINGEEIHGEINGEIHGEEITRV
jgi:hypothetical protein